MNYKTLDRVINTMLTLIITIFLAGWTVILWLFIRVLWYTNFPKDIAPTVMSNLG